jgi:hypothetical protein
MTVLRHEVERSDKYENKHTTGPMHPSGVPLCFVQSQFVFQGWEERGGLAARTHDSGAGCRRNGKKAYLSGRQAQAIYGTAEAVLFVRQSLHQPLGSVKISATHKLANLKANLDASEVHPSFGAEFRN